MRIGGIPFEMIGGLMVPKGYREINLVCPPIVPVAGAELLTDGNMEAVGVTSWPVTNATRTKEVGNPSGSGAQVLRVTGDGTNANGRASQTVLTAGAWYLGTGWFRGDGTQSPQFTDSASVFRITGTSSATWQQFLGTGRAGSTILQLRTTLKDGSGEFDEVSCLPLTFASMLVYLGTRNQLPGTYTCKPTLTAKTQCGLTIGYKDENNFLQIYHDGTTAFLVMCKAGTYSTLASGAAAYAALRELKVVIAANGTDGTLYYNGASIGTTTGIDPAVMGGHVYGFSTLASNTVGPVTTS